MSIYKKCNNCNYIFNFIDAAQDACHKCGASLEELTTEEYNIILKHLKGDHCDCKHT